MIRTIILQVMVYAASTHDVWIRFRYSSSTFPSRVDAAVIRVFQAVDQFRAAPVIRPDRPASALSMTAH